MEFSYPKARRDESAVDDYHGHKVADHYRWLEDPDSEETIAFVDAQNSISQPFIEQCPHRQKLHESLTEKWNFAKYSSPAERGGSYYYYCNSGLQNQSVLYVQDDLKSEPRVFLDPNTLSEDGTLSISGTAFSEDGSYFAYGLSKCGSDWITIQFKKAPSGEDLSDILKHVKFSSMAWTHDNKGMFYNRYPVEGKSDGTETTTNLYNKLYYHTLGTDQEEDLLTVEFQNEPKWKMQSTEVSDSYSYHNQWQSPYHNYTSSYGSTYVMSGTAVAAMNEWQKPIFGACAPPSYLTHPPSFASGGISCFSSQSVKPDTSQKEKESSIEMKKKKKTKSKEKQEIKCQKSCSLDPCLQNSSDFERNCNKLNNNNMPYCQNYGWVTPMHGYQNGQPYPPNPIGHYSQQYSSFSGAKEQTIPSYVDYSQLNVHRNNSNSSPTATNNCTNSYPTNNSRNSYNYNYPTTGPSNNNINPTTDLSNNSNYPASRLSNNSNNSYSAIEQSSSNQRSYYPAMVQPNTINSGYYPAMVQPNTINSGYYPAMVQPNINGGYMSNSSPTSHCELPYQQYNTNNKDNIHHQYQTANTGRLSTPQQNNHSLPLNSVQQQGSWYPPTTYFTTWQQSGNYSQSEPQNSSLYSTSSVTPVSNSFNLISPSYQSPLTSPPPVSNPKTFNTTQSSPSFSSNQVASFPHVGGQSCSQPWYQYRYPYYGGYPSFYSYPYSQYTSSVSCSDNAQVKCGQRNVQSRNLKSGEKASIPETIFVPNYRGAEVSVCGKYLLLAPNEGCDPVNRLFYVELDKLPHGVTENLSYVKLIDNFDAQYELARTGKTQDKEMKFVAVYITNEGSVFTFLTNLNAPKYKIINIDFQHPEPENWKTLVEEDNNAVLEWASCVNNNKLVLCYLKDVKNKLYVHQLETGKLEAEIPLDIGTIIGCSGRKKSKEIFIHFMSFLTPGIIYRVDMTVDKPTPEVFRVIKVNNFDFSQYEVKQVFYPSKDGTKIPMFLVHKKDLVLNGNTPTFLYGYGGFDISMKPTFSVSRLVFLKDLDGVYALANIRGGGEYGEKWHKSGTHANKQNVFDDFHAAAEYLINKKYTCPKRLIIHGQSNGGLLVAACINQRPELYGVALAQVGVMDMFRFHKFTIGHAWTTDFGCSDIPEQFEFLKKYSPLHNIRVPKADIQYPSTLLLTADHDDRVVPLHSFKFIAELQHTMAEQKKQTNPLLIKIDTKAGHGRGKPTVKIIQEQTDMYCFIVKTLGLDWFDS